MLTAALNEALGVQLTSATPSPSPEITCFMTQIGLLPGLCLALLLPCKWQKSHGLGRKTRKEMVISAEACLGPKPNLQLEHSETSFSSPWTVS